MKKYLFLFLLLILLIPVSGWGADCDGTGNCTAASCSRANVNTAYGNTAVGYTLTVPAGGCDWGGANVTVSKNITILGADTATSTPCTNTGTTLTNPSANGFFYISGTTTGVRISGFRFNLGGPTSSPLKAIESSGTHSNLRIDHNRLDGGKYQLWLAGLLKGVVYDNCLLNSDSSIDLSNYSTSPDTWNNMTAGAVVGTDTLYIEGNTFKRTNAGMGVTQGNCESPNEHIGTSGGGRAVIRYNTFDGSGYNDASICSPHTASSDWHIMFHGNQNKIIGHPFIGQSVTRGVSMSEIYNNYFVGTNIYNLTFRSGSILIHDNKLTSSGNTSIELREEESSLDNTGVVDKRDDSDWPAMDQVHNSFFWNNTFNGASPSVVFTVPGVTMIQEGRDYWRHAPQSSGGKETLYTGTGSYTCWDGSGNSYTCYESGYYTRSPIDAHKMTFSSFGANAYYPYTPYQCPHPLTGYAESCAEGGQGIAYYRGGEDRSPPIVTLGTPSCATGTMSISVSTNEPADCKYDATETAYGSMGSSFSTTDNYTHTATFAATCTNAYTRNVACQDKSAYLNKSTYQVLSYSPPAGDEDPPILGAGGAVVSATGNSITFTFTEASGAIRIPSDYSGWALTATSGARTLTYTGGINTLTLTYSISGNPIANGETVTVLYTKPASGGIQDPSGNELASIASPFSVTNSSAYTVPTGEAGSQNQTIWASVAPVDGNLTKVISTCTDRENQGVELATRFQSSQVGFVRGVGYWKLPEDQVAGHKGNLWNLAGTNLGTVTFSTASDSSEGWKYVAFAAPVPIKANTQYLVSVYFPPVVATSCAAWVRTTTVGGGRHDANTTLKYLTALAWDSTSPNGMYLYSAVPASTFPTVGSATMSNYWITPIFDPAPTIQTGTGATVQTGTGPTIIVQ